MSFARWRQKQQAERDALAADRSVAAIDSQQLRERSVRQRERELREQRRFAERFHDQLVAAVRAGDRDARQLYDYCREFRSQWLK